MTLACGMLVPTLEIEPMPPALEVRPVNHWTTQEVPCELLKLLSLSVFSFPALHFPAARSLWPLVPPVSSLPRWLRLVDLSLHDFNRCHPGHSSPKTVPVGQWVCTKSKTLS